MLVDQQVSLLSSLQLHRWINPMQPFLNGYAQNPCPSETPPAGDITDMGSKGMTYKKHAFFDLLKSKTISDVSYCL
jgi:hypothetical protein